MNEIFVPVMGMAPDDVVLTSWLKKSGDRLVAGEPVALVETSKAELEIESPSEGLLGRQLFPEHASIAPGTVIAHVLAPGESEPAHPAAPTGDATEVVPAGTPATDSQAATGSDRPRHTLSPRQRRIQAEAARQAAQPELERTEPVAAGTASATRPTSPADELHSTRNHAAPAEAQTATTGFRAAISAAVTRSWQEIPHFAVTRELRVDDLVESVHQWRVVLPALTLTDLLLRALALSLLDRERTSDLDIGLAVATDQGVAIPVIRAVPRLGLVELVDARVAAVRRARDGRLHADDSRVPTSTLSNLGAIGVDQFTGVVPYGQTSLLTVGRAAPRPVVENGALAVATTMYATLNVDHRSWDGYHAGQVLDRLAQILAAPAVFLGGSAPSGASGQGES